MAEDLTAPSERTATESPASFWNRRRATIQIAYVLGLFSLTLALLLWRTEPTRLRDGGLLFLLFLILSIVCTELGFALSPEVTTDLGGLFSGAAVLTLGFNGVWVPFLANLYWLLKHDARRAARGTGEARSLLSRLGNYGINLSLSALPLWLAFFVYRDLLDGELPLTDLGANLVPVLIYVVVVWLALPIELTPLLVIAQQGLRGAVHWFGNILTGYALSFFVPALFSPALAVILNQLGLGFFLLVSLGLLGISLMAQRLAHSLASERRRVEELTALNALGQDIIHSLPSVQATGALMAEHLPRFLPDADFEVSLFDGEKADQRQVVFDWRDGAARPAGDSPLSPLWTWLGDRRRILHLADANREPLPFAWEEGDGPRPGSLLLIPLLAADPGGSQAERCIGGLLMKHNRAGAFTAKLLPSATALANQLAAALENARLHQEALAHERLERELALARGIQTSFLPAGVPQIEGWTFVASLEPARHVSGDFYDFIPLPDGLWGLLIADVADKGMPAALYMALARTLIRAHAPDHVDDPAACLVAANDQILSDTQSDLFVTTFYGLLNPATGAMAYANAGHIPPFLCRKGLKTVEQLANTGMALGVLPGIPLDTVRTALAPGDYLVLYTDGVTEAHDASFNQFGSARLLAEAVSPDGAPPGEIHHRIRAAVADFVGSAPQADDLTLMVVGRDIAKGS